MRDRHGWGHKNLWVVAPQFQGRITLQGGEVQGRARLWFPSEYPHDPFPKEVNVLTLNPSWARSASRVKAYAQFPGGIIFPHSGLYYLEARYPGGSWCFTFMARQ